MDIMRDVEVEEAFVSVKRELGSRGCGNGIGFALAKRLSTEGFLVFAGCRDSKCKGAKELSRLKNIRVLQMDVSRDEEVEDAFATIDRELGLNALWSVVANAGVRTDGLLEWHTMDSIVKIFNVNVFGTLRVIKKFLPMLKRSKGRVIVMNSPLGHVTIPMEVPYCMTKHALVSMVDGFRRECQGKGVDFINMEPSAYKTQITANFGDPDLVEQDLLRQPPDVRADYSTEAVQRWLQFPKILFDIINRDNLDEVVDPIVLAIREADPDTCYVSPWRLGAKELSQLKNIRVLQLDVTRDEEVEEAFSIVKRELGSRVLWSVVANAGVRNDGLLEWMTMDSIIKVFNVNVFGTLRVTKKFLPMLKKSKGRMIVISSPFGHFTMPLGVAYCMTKHALVSMVDGLRRECRGKGVDFINIEPAAYKTRMTANLGDPGLVQQDWQQQSAEVTAHYSKAEIRRWSRLPRLIYDIIERENLEEVVDQIMLAIRETDPKTCYISPWLFGNFMSHVPRILPTELADLAIGTIVTRVPFVLRLAGYGAKKSK
ncbi:hypothetical protein V5799_034451 [Amblyomma americanum]|uniref:Uncharacterized protein n=1 Tax=Amblyomma americanum TaxID=6943 RepID=A0AAQ4DKE7_AMBAM